MSDQIRTAAELDALHVGSIVARICSDGQGNVAYALTSEGWRMSTERIIAPRVGEYDLVGNHIGPLVVLYRPDAPARTEPTEEQVAEAAHRGFCERRDGDLPNTFEKYDELDAERMAWWRSAAHAVLALLPQQVAPSEEEIAAAIFHPDIPEAWAALKGPRSGWLHRARAVQKLYASAPTIAEVKAEAIEEYRASLPNGEEWLAEYTAGVRAQALRDAEGICLAETPDTLMDHGTCQNIAVRIAELRARAERGEA